MCIIFFPTERGLHDSAGKKGHNTLGGAPRWDKGGSVPLMAAIAFIPNHSIHRVY